MSQNPSPRAATPARPGATDAQPRRPAALTPAAAATGPGAAAAAPPPVGAIILDQSVAAGTYFLLRVPDEVLNLPPSAPLTDQLKAMASLLQEVVDALNPGTPPPPPPP